MTAMNKNNNSSERLKDLLRTLFQFDATELDFGIFHKAIGDFEPDEVFINGDAFYPKGYKVIDTEFKALMGV